MEHLRRFLDELGPGLANLDVVPLVLAVVLGGAIGLERELSGRPAGLRTHILVCLSSTLLILVSRAVTPPAGVLGDAGSVVFDPNRMGAGIVTGIGFLGAATVLRSGDVLRGLTTAACIWFVAGLGIVLGTHQFALAIVGTAIVLLVLTVVNRLASLIRPLVYRRLIVIANAEEIAPLVASIRTSVKRRKMRIVDVASGHCNETHQSELVFFLALKNELQAPELTEEVARLENVLRTRWKALE